MSTWDDFGREQRVVEILQDVRPSQPGHHLGRPFLTSYQIAIELERRHPDIVAAIGKPLGGAETEGHTSLSQYLARQRLRPMRSNPHHVIEGAFYGRQHVASTAPADARQLRATTTAERACHSGR